MKTGKPEINKKDELRLPCKKNGNGHLTANDRKHKRKKRPVWTEILYLD